LLLGASLAVALALGLPSFAQDKASQTFIKQAIEANRAISLPSRRLGVQVFFSRTCTERSRAAAPRP
jgi:hypothetical protein